MARAKPLKKKKTKTNAKISKKKNFLRASQKDASNWPSKKNIFFRPARSSYVRRENKPAGCVFCRASKESESLDSLCVYKSPLSMVVLNKFPYNSGHLLVLPLRHCGDLLELNQEEYLDLHQTLKLALQAQKQIYAPAAANIGMNHGAAAGAGLPEHLHYHLIPRWAGDLNFFPLIAETKVVIETLEQTYQRYFEYFNSLRGHS